MTKLNPNLNPNIKPEPEPEPELEPKPEPEPQGRFHSNRNPNLDPLLTYPHLTLALPWTFASSPSLSSVLTPTVTSRPSFLTHLLQHTGSE